MRPRLSRLTAVSLGLCATLATVGMAPVAAAHRGSGDRAQRHYPGWTVPARTTALLRRVPSTGGPVTANPSYIGAGGYALAVDSVRGLVYMPGSDNVDVYHESTRTATRVAIAAGGTPSTVEVDPVTGYSYVPRGGNTDQVTVLRAGKLVGSVTLPGRTNSSNVAVDPVRHLAYVTGSSSIFVLRGAELVATVPVGNDPYQPAVNPANGLVYVPNDGDASVSVIKGTEVVATVETRGYPTQAAVDPLSGLVYVTNYDNTVSVLQGTRTEPVATLPVGAHSWAVAVDTRTHLVYVADFGDQTVTVIRGTRVLKTLHVPVSYDRSLAVNPTTGLVLAAGDQVVTGIRGTKVVSTSPVGEYAWQPVFDTRSGRAFVTTDNTLLDLQTPTVSTVTLRRPQQGHVYHRGARASARYRCTAGTNNVLRSCTAWIKNGGRLATRRIGRHSFTVTARSAYGPAVRTTVHYRVRR